MKTIPNGDDWQACQDWQAFHLNVVWRRAQRAQKAFPIEPACFSPRMAWKTFYGTYRASAFYANKVIDRLPPETRLSFWYAISKLDPCKPCNVDWLALRQATVECGIDRATALRGTL